MRANTSRWRWFARSAALGATMFALGCAPQANQQQTANANLELRGMIATDQQQIAELKDRINQMQDQLDELRHSGVGGGGRMLSRRQYATVNDRLSKLEAQVSALQAAASATTPPVPGAATPPLSATPPAAGAPSDAVPPTSATGIAPVPGPEGAAPAAIAPPEALTDWRSALDQEMARAQSSSDPAAPLFVKGLDAMKGGDYPSAVARFGALMRRYPKSDLTEPAEYFSANALYEQGKYEQSILQFNDLVIRSPKGRYASAALMREAQAFLKINDRIDARLTLQKLLADHSASAEASAANSMLKNLQAD